MSTTRRLLSKSMIKTNETNSSAPKDRSVMSKTACSSFATKSKPKVSLKYLYIDLQKGPCIQTQESRKVTHNISKRTGSMRVHSLSQNYDSKAFVYNRSKSYSTNTTRFDRPIFNKLSPVNCDEEVHLFPNMTLQKSMYNTCDPKIGRNNIKFNYKCNSITDSTTVASTPQKWSDSLKNHKREKLGYFIDCASSIVKTPSMSSQRLSQTLSMKENMESNIDKADLVKKQSHAIRLNSTEHNKRHLSLQSKGTKRANIQLLENQICISKPMSRNQNKSNNINSLIEQKMDKIKLKSALVRNTFIEKSSLKPLVTFKPKEPTNTNELVEFIEIEDFCRRDTETKDRSSQKLSFQTPQNERQRNKKFSKYLKSVNTLNIKSNTKKGCVNDTSHLVKKMSITFGKDNKIIYD
jgi:hypothetical protein